MRDRLNKQKQIASEKIDKIKQAGGLSDEAYDRMRAILLDIDPTSMKDRAGAPSDGDHYLR